jgi:IclR family transcriptional regulator, acetate operon repressor
MTAIEQGRAPVRSESDGMTVLTRAFEVLAIFGPDEAGPLSLTGIARKAGLPKTTAHRLLGALVAVGAVERSGGGYRLGTLLFELGERVPQKSDLREAALPFLQDLYEATHETVHLAVLDHLEVLYVERIRGHRQQPRLASRVGGRLAAHATGVGKALLAFTPEAAEEVLRQGPLEARTPYTITQPRLLAEEMARIRSKHLAVDREENAIGVHCVATPVLVSGRAVAAISVTGPEEPINEMRVGSAVRTAALGLQRTLAGRQLYLRAP